MDVIDAIYEGKEVFLDYVRTVEDLMSGAEYLTLDHRIEDALRFLKKHSCRHILVIDLEEPEKGVTAPPKVDLIGIVSQRDLARALSRGVGTLVETDEDQKALKQPIGALVTRNPHTVREDTPLAEAIELMVHKKIDCLPVVREPRTPVGVLTTHDVIKCFVRFQVLRNARPSSKPGRGRLIDLIKTQSASKPIDILVNTLFGKVGDLMQEAVLTVRVSDKLGKAMELMREHEIRHLPVVDSEGNLKGVVSDRDLLAVLPPLPQTGALTKEDQPRFRSKLFYVDEGDRATATILAEEVSSIMTGTVVTVDPLKPISELADLFCNEKFSSVPVVAEGQKGIAGIVTHTDILCAILALHRLIGHDTLAKPEA